MTRYKTPKGAEVEFEPGSHGRVLRNRLGLKRKCDMDQAEYEALLRAQTAWLDRIGPSTRFTAALICRMHEDWLGSIYDWAGRYRTVEVAKGDFHWPPAYRIEENMKRLERGALRNHSPCRPGPVAEAARRMAEVHAELLLIFIRSAKATAAWHGGWRT